MARKPARKAGVLDRGAPLPVRDGLSAGGNRIRTIGPALARGSRLLPKGDAGPISRMGSFKHGSRKMTMVGRGSPPLQGRLSFTGGTDRRYGADGEDGNFVVDVIDGVPRCPSQTTPACAGAGSEQIPRRPGSK